MLLIDATVMPFTVDMLVMETPPKFAIPGKGAGGAAATVIVKGATDLAKSPLYRIFRPSDNSLPMSPLYRMFLAIIHLLVSLRILQMKSR